jgi:glycine/D-amino acid oxidase-like deaminating enzyme/nitrite reductase/ring-hydroxylating ferredoxin subunit
MKLSGKPHPLWLSRPGLPYQPLSGDTETDVAIVGAGLTGLTAALRLIEAGRRVLVLERDRVGSGETGHTTAHLTEMVDARYAQVVQDFGEEGARLVGESSRLAIDEIERLTKTLEIACRFERLDGYLYTERPQDVPPIEEEVEAARRAGIAAEMTRDVPLPFATAGGLRVARQAQFHTIAYLRGLAAYVASQGATIAEQSIAREFHDGEPCRVVTDRGVVRAREVIVAAHVPVSNRVLLHTKIAAYRSYAIAARVRGASAPRGLFWDTDDPYHYTRTHSSGRTTYLIVGGEDHKTGTEAETEECFVRLDEYARARHAVEAISYRWSGQIIEPVDGLPYIGRNAISSHLHVATGYSGNGMTFGVLAGMILADQILRRPNQYADLYAATRVTPLASAADYLTENLDYPAYFIADRLTRFDAERKRPDALEPGEGGIFVVDGEKRAICRDDARRLHSLSPVCTHLGCDVRWNAAERTWDCPCHGSRFSSDGRVLNGPATVDLQAKPLPAHTG